MATKTKAKNVNQLTIDDANKMLEENIVKLFENRTNNVDYQEFLKIMSKQPNYSARNLLLIANQKPDARIVMGYKEWQKLGRNVVKGETSLKILAPITRKFQEDEKDKQTGQPLKQANGENQKKDVQKIVGFRAVSVFDVSQTDGKPIVTPQSIVSRSLQDDEEISKLYHDFKRYLNDHRIPVTEEHMTGKLEGAGGYYSPSDHRIAIGTNTNENDPMKFRVLIHEYAHSKLHSIESGNVDLPAEHKEAQAESVAYVVNHYYGQDTGDISNGYILTWAKEPKLALQSIQEIQDVATEMIEEINLLQRDKLQEADKDIKAEYEETKAYLVEKVGIKQETLDTPVSYNTEIPTSLQLINKEHGYVLSGTLEYGEKNDSWYLRTNRNMIEPLSELHEKNGKLAVLNVEQEQGQLRSYQSFDRIESTYEVAQVKEGIYVVQSSAGKDVQTEQPKVISREFDDSSKAEEFVRRSSMAQALHESTIYSQMMKKSELKRELESTLSEVTSEVNKQVASYIGHHSQKSVTLHVDAGIKIGWAVLKNPNLKTIDDLHEEADKKSHVLSGKQLKEKLIEMEVKDLEPKQANVKKSSGMELSHER